MKNLKRVLSLGLASVMLLGMMVVGASAKDFTDAEDIIHDEAVQTLVALNVVAGKEDGSYFDPKGDVTRGEMAKMITVVMQGGSEVNTGVKATPSFTDIGDHWAEPYIEYCYDLNIISGRGDGTFDPNGKVTGLEATKMVLTALGYDADAYKLNGASWATRTDEVARTAKGKALYENLGDVTMSQPATRDTAAQLIWNGLQAYTVTIDPGQNKNNGEVTWNYNTDAEVTLLNQRYKAHVMLAQYMGNHDYNDGTAGPEKGQIDVKAKLDVYSGKNNKIITKGTEFAFPSDMSIDNIGEEVKVVWKNGEKSTNDGPDKNDTIFGVFNTGATRVVRSELGLVKDDKSSKKQLNIDGNKYDVLETGVEIITNFGKKNTVVCNAAEGSTNNLTKALKFNSGNALKAVFDENGKIDKIYVTQTYLAAITGANSTSVTLNNGIGNLKFEDHDIEEDLVKGDVVAVTPLYGDGEIANATITVKKAEKISGEVTGYKSDDANNEDESVTMGGKTYKISYKNKNDGNVNFRPSGVNLYLLRDIPGEEGVVVNNFWGHDTSDNSYIGEDFDLYLVNGYVLAAVQTSESANNYSVITEVKNTSSAGATFGGLQLQVMGADGTKEIITVSKDSTNTNTHKPEDSKITYEDYNIGDIVTYTFDSDDNAEVTIRGKVASGKSLTYNEKTKSVRVDGRNYATDADCVLFAQTEKNLDGTSIDYHKVLMEKADFDAYDIRALDYLNKSGTEVSYALNKDGDKVMAVFVNYEASPDGASDDTVYGIVSSYNGRVKDYYTYTVQVNGEEYEINCKNEASSDIKKGDLVSFRPTVDNNYNKGKVLVAGVAKFAPRSAFVKEYNSKDDTVTFYNTVRYNSADKVWEGVKSTIETYALDKDVKIVYVDQDNDKSLAESSIDEFSAINGRYNISFITKSVTDDAGTNNVITVLFVETSGKVDVDNGTASR